MASLHVCSKLKSHFLWIWFTWWSNVIQSLITAMCVHNMFVPAGEVTSITNIPLVGVLRNPLNNMLCSVRGHEHNIQSERHTWLETWTTCLARWFTCAPNKVKHIPGSPKLSQHHSCSVSSPEEKDCSDVSVRNQCEFHYVISGDKSHQFLEVFVSESGIRPRQAGSWEDRVKTGVSIFYSEDLTPQVSLRVERLSKASLQAGGWKRPFQQSKNDWGLHLTHLKPMI